MKSMVVGSDVAVLSMNSNRVFIWHTRDPNSQLEGWYRSSWPTSTFINVYHVEIDLGRKADDYTVTRLFLDPVGRHLLIWYAVCSLTMMTPDSTASMAAMVITTCTTLCCLATKLSSWKSLRWVSQIDMWSIACFICINSRWSEYFEMMILE